MEITINVPDKLAAESPAHGVSVEIYVQELLAREVGDSSGEARLQIARAAVERIIQLRKANKLAGLPNKGSYP